MQRKAFSWRGRDRWGRGQRQRGFTITELIIASTLAIIISAMMFTVLTTQERTSGRSESTAQMQDHLRFSLQVMSKHLRMAGYGIGPVIAGTTATSIAYPSLTVSLPSFAGLPTLFGCDGCGSYDYNASTKTDTTIGTDQVAAVYRNPGLEFQLDWVQYRLIPSSSALMKCQTTSELLPAPLTSSDDEPIELLAGSNLVCMDDSAISSTSNSIAWTLQEAGVVKYISGGTLDPLTVIPDPGNASFNQACPTSLPYRMTCGSIVGSSLGFYVHKETLYMDDNGDSFSTADRHLVPKLGGDGLPVDDIPLAEGIEDMQIAWCIPRGSTGDPSNKVDDMGTALTDCLQNPEASAYWNGASAKAKESDIPYAVAIRITLVAKGHIDESGRIFASKRPSAENHSPADQPDSSSRPATTRYPRLIQSTVVQLPNPRYMRGLSVEFE